MKASKPSPAGPDAPDWNDLKVLLALARGGSVAGAARAMGVDPSTVSRRLAALEQALGCPLLVRGGREFAWTTEGRTMIVAAEAAEAAIDDGIRDLRSARLAAKGTVRVSTTPGLAAFLLRAMPELQAKHPNLEIDVSGTMQYVDLAKGDADIALRAGQPGEPDVIAKKMFRSGWFLYASPEYLRFAGELKAIADLPRHRLVLMTPNMHAMALGLRWLEDHRGESTSITRIDNLQSAVQVALLGRGIVSLPHSLAHMEAGLVRAWPEPIATSDAYLVYHASLRGVARIRGAVDALTELMEAHGEEWSGLPAARR
jgi:DNA-binding transcriptional LysR family regulator